MTKNFDKKYKRRTNSKKLYLINNALRSSFAPQISIRNTHNIHKRQRKKQIIC